MSKHTLYLTAEERKIFERLPAVLRNTCHIANETRTFPESKKHFQLRRAAVTFESKKLRELSRKLAHATSIDDIQTAMATADLSDISHKDIIGMYFIAGPRVLSVTIVDRLMKAETEQDLEEIGGLCGIRSVLFDVFVPVSHSRR